MLSIRDFGDGNAESPDSFVSVGHQENANLCYLQLPRNVKRGCPIRLEDNGQMGSLSGAGRLVAPDGRSLDGRPVIAILRIIG